MIMARSKTKKQVSGSAPKRAPRTAVQKSGGMSVIRAALSSGQPGQWSSDHRAESEKFTGSDYIAIHAICMQAAQASACVYDDSAPNRAMKRAALRKSFGSMSKYRRLVKSYGADDATEPLPETHPLVKLLCRPSPKQSGALFRYEQLLQLRLTGTILIWNVPNRLGQTCERYVVPTGVALPRPPAPGLPEGGWYVQPALASRYAQARDPEGFVENRGFAACIGKVIPSEQVQVIRLPHPLWKDDGQSPVAASALWKDSADMVDRARWGQLKRGADSSLIVSLDKEFQVEQPDLDRIKAKLQKEYGGVENAGAIIVMSGGATATPTTMNPKDMAYDLGFTQIQNATLAVHGVPGMAAGIASPTGREGLYAPLLQFSLLTVQPLLSILAEEDTISLAPQFGTHLTVEIEAASIDDPEVLERELANDASMGVRTINEVRSIRGLPPVPWGEERAWSGGQAGTASSMQPSQQDYGATPSGEFAGISRQQFTRNRKAINDILGDLADGTITEARALAEFAAVGITEGTAAELVQDTMRAQAEQAMPAGPGFKSLLKAIRRRLKVHGLSLAIEHLKGSVRTGVTADGESWSRKMAAHYGYISRTESGADGDAIDVFVGPEPDAEIVFVLDQVNEDGTFDEHKCLIGWTNAEDAEAGYLANYPKGWKCGELTPMTVPQFKAWLKEGDLAAPAASYQGPVTKSVNGSRINGHGDWLGRAVASMGRAGGSDERKQPESIHRLDSLD